MPAEAKPLFRPDILRSHLAAFVLPERAEAHRDKVRQWAALLAGPQAGSLKESELLPQFLSDIFQGLLGYNGPVDNPARYTLQRETNVVVDGKYADAVLGEFRPEGERFVVAVEGKGPRDPLERPHAGRAMSAVDQAYRYAINLPCDWILVTSMRQTRLYHKGADQSTYERFDLDRLAEEDGLLRKFVFLLGADRVVPHLGSCHLDALRTASHQVGRELTREYYDRYASMRHSAFNQLVRANPNVAAADLLAATQKLLDRVLFCSFCEDRGLLPADTIGHAYAHADPYNPRPIWENFRGLFHAIDLYLRRRPDATVSDLMRTVKARSSKWVHDTFPALGSFAWQEGYGVFTVNKSQERVVKKYIAGHAEHHKK
jgi:hypothetical protein